MRHTRHSTLAAIALSLSFVGAVACGGSSTNGSQPGNGNGHGNGPTGVANGSGKVGKYIMDTVGANFSGQVPLLENLPLHNEDGVDGLHLYTPWWLYKEQLAGKLGFARGYHFEFGGGRLMPGANADITVLSQREDPPSALVRSDRRDVEFVAISGRPMLAAPVLRPVFDARRVAARPISVDRSELSPVQQPISPTSSPKTAVLSVEGTTSRSQR